MRQPIDRWKSIFCAEMKEALNQLFKKGFLEIGESEESKTFLFDPTSENVDSVFRPIDTEFKLIFEHDGVLDRFFPSIPETYFQLLELNEKPLDVILEKPSGFAPSLMAKKQFYCTLAKDKELKQLLQRFRKPVLCAMIPSSSLNSPEFQLLLHPENQKIQLNILNQQNVSLIHFKADGSFKMLKK